MSAHEAKECCTRCAPQYAYEEAHHHHEHEHGHIPEGFFTTPHFIGFVIGSFLFLGATLMDNAHPLRLWIFVSAYALIGGEILLLAVKNIFKGHLFDENFLMSLATVGAFSIGEYPEGVAVMFFYRIGEFFQDLAVARSKHSIGELMDIRPDFAMLITSDGEQKVSPELVEIGAHIVVRAGEKIPLDGLIIEGQSSLDTSALSGESLPKEVKTGDEVLSGSINLRGVLVVKTQKCFADSTVSKILDLVQNASAKKAKTEQFITTFARYYTPFVVVSAALLAFLPPLLFEEALLSEWFKRALVFLVVSCPCALVVSIPLSFFGGIGGASKKGILVKGGNFLEALNRVETVVFDKTGTLTQGHFDVAHVEAYEGYEAQEVLRLCALAEFYSNHPIAHSIKRAYKEPLVLDGVMHEELAGYGVSVRVGESMVLVGNQKLLRERGIEVSIVPSSHTVVYVVRDGDALGHLIIEDSIKEDAKDAIQKLYALGIKRVVMLTGDNENSAQNVAQSLGIREVFAGLLPYQKVEKLESIMASSKGKTIFVGDGINDAPVLARADIGIAMGGVGSDAAIEASDVVIMNDEISKVATAISVARQTHAIVWQNIIFALGVKGVILILGAFGIAGMWEAVFGDVGVALIAVLNASRVLHVKA